MIKYLFGDSCHPILNKVQITVYASDHKILYRANVIIIYLHSYSKYTDSIVKTGTIFDRYKFRHFMGIRPWRVSNPIYGAYMSLRPLRSALTIRPPDRDNTPVSGCRYSLKVCTNRCNSFWVTTAYRLRDSWMPRWPKCRQFQLLMLNMPMCTSPSVPKLYVQLWWCYCRIYLLNRIPHSYWRHLLLRLHVYRLIYKTEQLQLTGIKHDIFLPACVQRCLFCVAFDPTRQPVSLSAGGHVHVVGQRSSFY